MQQLYDALMETIEPKLMTGARKQTASELAAMAPEERGEWMLYLQKAYEEFMARWPKFVASAIAEMQKMGDVLVELSGKADQSAIRDIEKNFNDSSASAAPLKRPRALCHPSLPPPGPIHGSLVTLMKQTRALDHEHVSPQGRSLHRS